MTTLEKFSDKEREYHLYQSRQNALREQKTIQISLEESKRAVIAAEEKANEAAEKANEAEEKANEAEEKANEAEEKANEAEEKLKASEQKNQRLLEILEKQGINPDN